MRNNGASEGRKVAIAWADRATSAYPGENLGKFCPLPLREGLNPLLPWEKGAGGRGHKVSGYDADISSLFIVHCSLFIG